MAEQLILEEQKFAEVAGMLKALTDPNRLRIFDMLMHGDSCNCELKDRLGLPNNLLSHHLRVLKEAGLVEKRRDALDGRWIYYAINRKSVTYWQRWFNEFFDPARVQTRQNLCGPEGQQVGDKACRPQGAGV